MGRWKRRRTAKPGQPFIEDRAALDEMSAPLREAAMLKAMTAKEREAYKALQRAKEVAGD